MSETDQATEAVEQDGSRDDGLSPPRFAPPRKSVPAFRPRKARIAGLRASLAHALEQRQFFVLLPFAMILGTIAFLFADAQPAPSALTAVGVALLAALWLLRRSQTGLRVSGLLVAFWFGFCLLAIHGALFGTPMLKGSLYGSYRARVDAVLAETPKGRRLLLSAITPVPPAKPADFRRARVLLRNGPPLAPGDVIESAIYFYTVPGPPLPGGYDAEFQSYFAGIGAYGSAQKATLLKAGDFGAPDRLIDTIRQQIAARIAAVLPQPSNGIARAIITGDQTDVEEGPRRMMATAGLAHVMAISGLHLSLIAGSVFFVLRLILSLPTPLGRYFSVKKLAAIGAIGAALAYFAISGGGAAALRSTITALLIFGAVLIGRRALSMRNIAIAGLFTILTEPSEIFRPGFQLSFAAVIGLVGIYEMLPRSGVAGRGLPEKVMRHFGGIALTSLIGGAATAIFAIYHFQQTSPLGIIGNLMVMPLVAIVMMPSAMLAVLAMPFGFERPFIWVMGWSIDRMLDAAGLVAGWSAHINAAPILTPMALLLALLGLAWFAFFTNRYRLLGPALTLPLITAFAVDKPPDVLISDTTQALAMRTSNDLVLVAGRPDTFAVDLWGENYRQTIATAPPGTVTCDAAGCLSRSSRGFNVAIDKDDKAFPEDCANADLVVTKLRAPAYCRDETTVVDRDDLASGGVHWLRWNAAAGRFDVRPAITDLNRPWRAGRW